MKTITPEAMKQFIADNYGPICDQIYYLWFSANKDKLVSSEDDAVLKAVDIVMYLRTGSSNYSIEGITEDESNNLIISEIDYFNFEEDDEFPETGFVSPLLEAVS